MLSLMDTEDSILRRHKGKRLLPHQVRDRKPFTFDPARHAPILGHLRIHGIMAFPELALEIGDAYLNLYGVGISGSRNA
jgi:hypothetical protein